MEGPRCMIIITAHRGQYVEEVLERGNDCILEIDPQGAFQVRAAWPEAILIFIAPPSLEELRSRLSGRGTESAEEMEKRLSCALEELEQRVNMFM